MKNFKKGFTLIEIMVTSAIIGFIILGMSRFTKEFLTGYNFSFQETQAISEAQQAITVMERELREMRDGVDGSYPLVTADDNELVFYGDVDDDGDAERVRYYLVGTDLIKQVFEYIPGQSNYACVNGCDICHDPGNNENTITIPEAAWPAHSNHGDYLGTCIPGGEEGQLGSTTTSERIVASYIQVGVNPIFSYYNSGWPTDELNNPLILENRLLDTRLIQIQVNVNINPQTNPDDFEVSTFVHLRNMKDNL
jgi:prepilin-type N-terminal cleavage/methylation domain-containing protein